MPIAETGKNSMALWLNRSGRHCEHERKFLDDNRIYLTWGGLDRDLSKLDDRKALMAVLEEIYPKFSQGHRIQNSGQIWAFARRMNPGDWVAVPSKRKTIHIGEITGEYAFDAHAENPYYHYRAVRWLETDIPRTNFDQDILNARGFTTHHSAKGPDGGIDLLAVPGTLGFGNPRICVQVKSQSSPLERPVLDQLVGAMQHVGAEQGLLVCWGGFKKTILKEVPRLFFKVRVWDQNDLIDQFLAVYDKLDEDLRTEIPLKRIWTVAAQDQEEKE